MKEDDLRHLLAVRPFRPMELRTSDGEVYRLTSPEVMVDDSMTVILDEGKFRFIDNEAIVSLRRLNGRRPGSSK